MNNTKIRFATEDDVALIVEFIRGIAEYEKMLDEVIADEDLIREWVFRRNKAEVIFALEDGKEVGFALFFHNFSTILVVKDGAIIEQGNHDELITKQGFYYSLYHSQFEN